MIPKPKTTLHGHRASVSKNSLRIIPLGSLEEVGRNMTVFEYGDDIIIVDCGLMFPEEEMMGIDYIIPNIEYLKAKKEHIRGIIITHGHLDHIGAIPHIAPELGNPPIYATELTRGIIVRRQEDYKHHAPLNVKVVRKIDRLALGAFKVEFSMLTIPFLMPWAWPSALLWARLCILAILSSTILQWAMCQRIFPKLPV